jgi:hypothetical protein
MSAYNIVVKYYTVGEMIKMSFRTFMIICLLFTGLGVVANLSDGSSDVETMLKYEPIPQKFYNPITVLKKYKLDGGSNYYHLDSMAYELREDMGIISELLFSPDINDRGWMADMDRALIRIRENTTRAQEILPEDGHEEAHAEFQEGMVHFYFVADYIPDILVKNPNREIMGAILWHMDEGDRKLNSSLSKMR